MTVQVLAGPTHDCAKDGHMIALRLRYEFDSPSVRIVPFCEVCRALVLPASSMEGKQADWLMSLVARAQHAPDASPEAYERMFA